MPFAIDQLNFIPSQPNLLAVRTSKDLRIHILDLKTGKSLKRIHGIKTSFVTNPQGTQLAAASPSRVGTQISIYDMSDSTKKAELKHTYTVPTFLASDTATPHIYMPHTLVSFANNDTQLIITNNKRSHILFLKIKADQEKHLVNLKRIQLEHSAIAFNPLTNTLVSYDLKNSNVYFYTFDPKKQMLYKAKKIISLNKVNNSCDSRSLKIDSMKNLLAVSTRIFPQNKKSKRSIYNLNSTELVKHLPENSCGTLAFGQDNKRRVIAVVPDHKKEIHLWYQEMLTLKELVVQCILKNKINTKNIPLLLLKI